MASDRPMTLGEVAKFTARVLRAVTNPSLVDSAVHDALKSMDLPTDVYQPESIAPEGGPAKKKRKNAKAEPTGTAGKGHRAIHPFSVFVSLAMGSIAKDPDNPSYKVPEKLDENGEPKADKRGGKMAVASKLWKELGDEDKNNFNATFKPLCEQLNEEATRAGGKIKDMHTRATAFLDTQPMSKQQEIKRLYEHKAGASFGKGVGLGGDGSSSEVDDTSDEPAPPPQVTNNKKAAQPQPASKDGKKKEGAKKAENVKKEHKKELKNNKEGGSKKKKRESSSDDE